jgi:hypothetical protein
MQIDLMSPLPPLAFAGFQLLLRRYTIEDRMHILDACAADDRGRISFAALTAATTRLVADWTNVTDTTGMNIPFERDDGSGGKLRMLPMFLARLPFADAMEVVISIMATVGVPRNVCDEMRKGFAWGKDESPKAGVPASDPTQPVESTNPSA